jgi:hypothetical protein
MPCRKRFGEIGMSSTDVRANEGKIFSQQEIREAAKGEQVEVTTEVADSDPRDRRINVVVYCRLDTGNLQLKPGVEESRVAYEYSFIAPRQGFQYGRATFVPVDTGK